MDKKVDEEEHSIEMHLPYIAKMMEGWVWSWVWLVFTEVSYSQVFKIVPILVGALDVEREALYGQLLSKYLLSEENLFVVSSDFCHWGTWENGRSMVGVA